MFMQRSPLEMQTPIRWNLIGRSMTAAPPCYRPTVFFCHRRLKALSFPQGNIQRAFQKLLLLLLLFKVFVLDLSH